MGIRSKLGLGMFIVANLFSLPNSARAEESVTDVKVKGNPGLEYLADSIGNQNGRVEPLEEAYLKLAFEKSDTVYACAATPQMFYAPGMEKIYQTLDEAVKYWQANSVRGPTAIVAFDKNGKMVGAYNVGRGVSKEQNPASLDYSKEMEERRNTIREKQQKIDQAIVDAYRALNK
jgi:hypothetical protein